MAMFRNLTVLIILTFAVGCSSSRPVVRTTQTGTYTPKVDPRKTKKAPTATTSKPTGVGKVPPITNSKPKENSDNLPASNQNTEVLEATTAVKVTTAMVLAYIDTYKEIAKNDMKVHGVPASITLGQGILESGAGTGPLSVQANNHFGIKCHKEWTGPSVSYDDDAVGECFRKYPHPHESFKDHSLFLVTRDRYASLFKLELDDYIGWSQGLKAAGYATDPAYSTKLITLIEKYQLYRYDAEVLGKPVPQIIPYKEALAFNSTSTSASKSNGNLHVVEKGDTLFSIARKYGVTVDDLKRKNNLIDTAISIGQTLVIN